MKTKLIVLLSLFGFVTFSAKVTGIEKKDTLPIRFTENLGQVTDQNYKLRTDIFFSGISESMAFHLRNNGISYQINKTISWIEVSDPKTKEKIKVADKISAYRLDINWVGINAEIKIIKGEAFGDYANYYSASCPNGVSNVKSYKSITYKNLYDNIDLQYYEKNGTLKYDYIVMPGSDYKKIKLYIDGANKITLQKNGSINFETPYGNINEAAPVVFQNNKLLPAKWVLSENILSFSIDNYDSKLPMVIDPAVRMWGTFYG
ncbi:MAG: hypothetical protein ABIP51_19370, partial [Bacteroidia bacterium]